MVLEEQNTLIRCAAVWLVATMLWLTGCKDELGTTHARETVKVETEDILVLSIVPANTEGEFAIMHGEKYMNLGSGNAPTFVNGSHAWPIEIDEDGNATIHGTTSNPNTPRALIYRSDSDIFKKVEQQEEGLT